MSNKGKKHKKLVAYPNKTAQKEQISQVPGPLGILNQNNPLDILIRHRVKTLGQWFNTWQLWQCRVLICHVMSYCSKEQLELLATSLEPILHLDFSTSFLPPFQALHVDGIAKFHVQRNITQRIFQPDLQLQVTSQDYLSSFPTTLQSKHVTGRSKANIKTKAKMKMSSAFPPLVKERETVHSVLPLTHPKHVIKRAKILPATSASNVEARYHQRFTSVPIFPSAALELRKVKENMKCPRKMVSMHFLSPLMWERRAENFKEQLSLVAKWMREWDALYKSYLLNQLVKFCDRDLLGYFVQCLHQQLQEIISIEILPDSVLLKIFSYLNPADLGRCAQACKRWNRCTNMAHLWKSHTHLLGLREGVGNVTEIMETVAQYSFKLVGERKGAREVCTSEVLVDWKKAYKELTMVVGRVKKLVVKRALYTKEDQLLRRIQSSIDKSGMYTKLSLQEMLQILRIRCRNLSMFPTTYELVQMAPFNQATIRRRRREERREAARQAARKVIADEKGGQQDIRSDKDWFELAQADPSILGAMGIVRGQVPSSTRYLDLTKGLPTPRSRELVWELLQLMMPSVISSGSMMDADSRIDQRLLEASRAAAFRRRNSFRRGMKTDREWEQMLNRELVQLIGIALDRQPAVPHLPDLDGIQCLILAGGLLFDHIPKPGKVRPLTKVRRLEDLITIVLCMQCDSKKMVLGTTERTVEIVDIRSGRSVSTLEGHKGSVQSLQFDDHKIVSGSWDTSCIVWDLIHFSILTQLNGHTDCVSCLQFNEEILVTGSLDGTLRVWNTANWEVIVIISAAHAGGVTCMKFNHQVIASGGIDKQVRLWSVDTYHCLATLTHKSPITALSVINLLLITCTLQGNVIFWNLDSHRTVLKRRLRNGIHFRQLACSNNKFYGAGSNGIVFEVDLCTATCTRTLEGHSRSITALWFIDYKLVTASADFTMVVWYFNRPTSSLKEEDTLRKWEEGRDEEGKLPIFTRAIQEDYYVDLPIKADTSHEGEHAFINLTE